MLEKSLLLCSGAVAVLVLASSLNAADSVLEGSVKLFLGKPRMDVQQVFEYQRHPNIVVTLKGTVGSRSMRPSAASARTRWWPSVRARSTTDGSA